MGTVTGNIGKLYSYGQTIYGVSPNLYDTLLPSYWYFNQLPDYSPYSFIQQLYTPMGYDFVCCAALFLIVSSVQCRSYSMVMGSLYTSNLQLSLTSDFYVAQTQKTNRTTYFWDRMRPAVFLDGAPRFTFSMFPSSSSQDALVSFPTFVTLTHDVLQSVLDIPMKEFTLSVRVFCGCSVLTVDVQLNASLTDDDLDALSRDLQRMADTESGVSVYDIRDELDTITVCHHRSMRVWVD